MKQSGQTRPAPCVQLTKPVLTVSLSVLSLSAALTMKLIILQQPCSSAAVCSIDHTLSSLIAGEQNETNFSGPSEKCGSVSG